MPGEAGAAGTEEDALGGDGLENHIPDEDEEEGDRFVVVLIIVDDVSPLE